MWRRSCNRKIATATGLLRGAEGGVYNWRAMMNRAIVTILTVLWTVAGALAQQAPEPVSDSYVCPGDATAAAQWANVGIATVLLIATLFVAFKDPRRTHLDE
jgi:hypothetical protein